MKQIFAKLPPKLRLYLPIVIGIVIAELVITTYSVNNIRKNIYRSIERNLVTEVQSLKGMFERERDLKLAKVKTDLKVAHKLYYQKKFEVSNRVERKSVQNQLTGVSHETNIYQWFLDGKSIYGDTTFVDEIFSLVGGTSTIFQKIDSGYVRITTNVRRSDGTRAIGTFIPNDSPVLQSIENGQPYIGRAYVVNSWYITAYEPIYYDEKIVGMLYVGDKEKDLDELRRKILSLKSSETAYPYVLDETGRFIIHPYASGEFWDDEDIIKTILSKQRGTATYVLKRDGKERMVNWDYFPDFKLYIASAVLLIEESGAQVREVIINSVFIGFVIILLLSLFVYFITTENVRNFLGQLELSSKKLKSVEIALEQSERHFQTLFNNSSDDIFVIDYDGNFVEVNQVACDNLGYTREEFLAMNIRDIKPEHLKAGVDRKISMIIKFGKYRYESENKAKDGHIIPVEMKSRNIDYKGKQVILTIARDISERKEMEDKILTTIIRTEENERKRFAADLHDDLGPILSTVKLYTDLLKKKNYKNIDENEAIKNIEELVDAAITSTRTISRNIRPNILQDFGLAAAVNDFCSFINKSESINIEVVTHQYAIEQRGIEESVLYQAVKELINNTIKHASAKNIRVELKSFENQIILYYRDDGKGFDLNEALQQNTGLGLNNIVNKIKSVKGTADINTKPGEGMFLIASLKLKPTNKKNGNS
ncbi:MAG: Cache 3/Cache 2 fusion domain-containing protein [Bacteroidales bacterium]